MNNSIKAALREFASKWGQDYDRYIGFTQNPAAEFEIIADLTALTSKLFVPKEDHDLILAENRQLKEGMYPKEFMEWYVTEGQFMLSLSIAVVPNPLDEAFEYWKENEK